MQTVLWVPKLRGNAPPRPINVVVSDRDENQVGKTSHRHQTANLSRQIAGTKNSSEKILALAFVIDERTNARALNRNQLTELLQSLRDTLNPWWRGVSIKKPVVSATTMRAPKRAPHRRDVNSHASTVADHGDVWQPRDQLSL